MKATLLIVVLVATIPFSVPVVASGVKVVRVIEDSQSRIHFSEYLAERISLPVVASEVPTKLAVNEEVATVAVDFLGLRKAIDEKNYLIISIYAPKWIVDRERKSLKPGQKIIALYPESTLTEQLYLSHQLNPDIKSLAILYDSSLDEDIKDLLVLASSMGISINLVDASLEVDGIIKTAKKSNYLLITPIPQLTDKVLDLLFQKALSQGLGIVGYKEELKKYTLATSYISSREYMNSAASMVADVVGQKQSGQIESRYVGRTCNFLNIKVAQYLHLYQKHWSDINTKACNQ